MQISMFHIKFRICAQHEMFLGAFWNVGLKVFAPKPGRWSHSVAESFTDPVVAGQSDQRGLYIEFSFPSFRLSDHRDLRLTIYSTVQTHNPVTIQQCILLQFDV